MTSIDYLRYPIGQFEKPQHFNQLLIKGWIADIGNFPNLLEEEVQQLKDDDWVLTYRPGGWNIKQLVHHCADSHMNAYIRFKLALTEEQPIIKPYREDLWAVLPDSQTLSIGSSLQILRGVHFRWTSLMLSLTDDHWQRQYHHPEHNQLVALNEAAANYSWHCKHHLEHIRIAKRKGSLN